MKRTITLDPKVFETFGSSFRVGFVLIEGFSAKTHLNESRHLLNNLAEYSRNVFHKDSAKTHDLLSNWESARGDFGVLAKHYHTSLEKLFKLILSRKSVSTPTSAHALSAYLSLRHLVPVGLDDYAKLSGDVTFSVATGREKRGLARYLHKGDLFYRDEKGVLATKLDYKRSPRTRVTDKSKKLLLHFDALAPVTKTKLQSALREAEQLFNSTCARKTSSFILEKKTPSKKI